MRYWLLVIPVLCATLFVACYNPKFGSPGYYCDPENEPACPAGQSCVNGRCVNPGSGGSKDMAGSIEFPDLKGADLKGSVVDMAKPPADFSSGNTGGPGSCGEYVDCVNSCASQSCASACLDSIDDDGYTKIQDAVNCCYDYCSFTSGVCDCDIDGNCFDSFDAPIGACDECLNDALSGLTGEACTSSSSPDCNPTACKSDVNACLNDTPG